MIDSNKPIGIFDSGVGGLTVTRAIKDLMPNENVVYFGDTLHLPYGEKSSTSIVRYSREITKFLLEKDCKAIIIACNSASAHAFEATRELVPSEIAVINVIDPVVDWLKKKHSSSNIGVIGTKATIRSKVYQNALEPLHSESLETPLLAAMVEEGFINDEVSKSVIASYLSDSKLKDIDTLILGCTHYPLLKTDVEDFFKGKVNVIDSGKIIAQALNNHLIEKDLINRAATPNKDEFYVSDYTTSFEDITSSFFGSEISLKELKIT